METLHLKPGTYRISELVTLLSISHSDLIETIGHLSIPTTPVIHGSEVVLAVVLNEISIRGLGSFLAKKGHQIKLAEDQRTTTISKTVTSPIKSVNQDAEWVAQLEKSQAALATKVSSLENKLEHLEQLVSKLARLLKRD